MIYLIVPLNKKIFLILAYVSQIAVLLLQTNFMLFLFYFEFLGWLVGCGIKAYYLHKGPRPEDSPLFLKDPSTYLREFRRKARKTLNGQIDKRDLGFNPAPQLPLLREGATGGVFNFWVVLLLVEKKNIFAIKGMMRPHFLLKIIGMKLNHQFYLTLFLYLFEF